MSKTTLQLSVPYSRVSRHAFNVTPGKRAHVIVRARLFPSQTHVSSKEIPSTRTTLVTRVNNYERFAQTRSETHVGKRDVKNAHA